MPGFPARHPAGKCKLAPGEFVATGQLAIIGALTLLTIGVQALLVPAGEACTPDLIFTLLL